MKVSTKSIWDQLYTFPSQCKFTTTNICEYTRGVLRGIVIALLFVIGGVLGGLFVLYPYFVWILYAVTGYYEPQLEGHTDSMFFMLSLTIQALLVCIVIFAVGHDALIPYRAAKRERDRAKPDGFIKVWYKSVKEKTCFIIERTD